MGRKIYLIAIIIMINFTIFFIGECFLQEELETKEACFISFVFCILLSIVLGILYTNSGSNIKKVHYGCKIAYVYNCGSNKYIVAYFQPNKKSRYGYKLKKSILKEGKFNNLNILNELKCAKNVTIFTNAYNEILNIYQN